MNSQYEESMRRMYEARLKEHQRMVYEAVYSPSQNQNQVGDGSASGSGGGGNPNPNTLLGLYGAASDGLLYSLDNFTNFSFNDIPIPSQPVVCNGGDGYIYLVVDDSGSTSFASINIATHDIFFYDNNISDFSQKGTGSLYREESGSFIYVDNGSGKSSITNIIRIIIDPIQGDADATLVNSIDSGVTGFLLKQLYLVDGSVWAIIDSSLELTGPFDINTGQFTPQPYQINTALKNGELVNIDWIISCVQNIQNNGIIYIYAVHDNSLSIGLFTFNIQSGGLTWVKDGEFPVEGITEYILTIFNI